MPVCSTLNEFCALGGNNTVAVGDFVPRFSTECKSRISVEKRRAVRVGRGGNK